MSMVVLVEPVRPRAEFFLLPFVAVVVAVVVVGMQRSMRLSESYE